MPQTYTHDEQKAIVQKMLDAGESEDNIATVIQHFQSTPEANAPEGSAVGRYAAGLWNQVSPLEIAKGLYQTVRHPVDTAVAAVGQMGDQWKQAGQEFDRAQNAQGLDKPTSYLAAGGHALAGSIPFVGPAAARIGTQAGAGDLAGAAGEATGLIGTVMAPDVVRGVKAGAGKAIQASGMAPKMAEMAQAAAERRVVDVMAPKVGPNKTRFGNMAEKSAPTVLNEPGMTALSREGLERKISEKLSAAEDELDKARDARPAGEIYDTAPIVAAIQEKLGALTAQAAEGPTAHKQVSAMGLDIPEGLPQPGTPFKALALPHKEQMRRLLSELEEFRYNERTAIPDPVTGGEYAREGGYGAGRGARFSRDYSQTDKTFNEASGGAPVYHQVLAGAKGTTRGDMIKSLRKYIEGKGAATPIVQRAWKVADERMRDPGASKKAMLPNEAGYADADVAGAIGASVVPAPLQPRSAVIQQALNEVKALGPAASYDALKRIRQAYDKQAAVKYSPSMTADFMKVQPAAEGAADVASSIRDALAAIDPEGAKANTNYSVWRKAHDVLRATAEIERTRPTVGRKLIARAAGAVTGGSAGGTLGAIVGYAVAPFVDEIMASAPTTKLVSARVLADLAKALKAGDASQVAVKLSTLKSLSKTFTRTAPRQAAPQESD